MIVLLLHWLATLAAMNHGEWATAVGPNLFVVTPRNPGGHGLMLLENVKGMHNLIRHGFECSTAGRSAVRQFICTPMQFFSR